VAVREIIKNLYIASKIMSYADMVPFLQCRGSPAVGGMFSTTYLRPARGGGTPHSPDKSGAAVSPTDKS
jgi:hypothetical protein